jgi:hypothetical protein
MLSPNMSNVAEDDETTVETVVIKDGDEEKTVPRDELNDYLANGPRWKAEQTKKSQAAAAAAAERNSTLTTRETAVAAREAALEELRRQATPEPEAEDDAIPAIDYSNLPNPVDDPEAFNAALGRAQAEREQLLQADFDRRLERTRAEGRAETDDKVKRVESTGRSEAARRDAIGDNRRLADRYYEANLDITPDQKQTMERLLNTSLRDPSYGQADPSGAFRYNDAAVAQADRMARPDHYDQLAQDKGYEEGLSQRNKAGRASRVNGRGSASITSSSTPEEIYNAAQKIPPGTPAERDFYDNLSDDQIDAYIAYGADQADELGG